MTQSDTKRALKVGMIVKIYQHENSFIIDEIFADNAFNASEQVIHSKSLNFCESDIEKIVSILI